MPMLPVRNKTENDCKCTAIFSFFQQWTYFVQKIHRDEKRLEAYSKSCKNVSASSFTKADNLFHTVTHTHKPTYITTFYSLWCNKHPPLCQCNMNY